MKLQLLTIIVLFAAFNSMGQTDTVAAEGGLLVLKERTIDLGTIRGDSIVKAEFTLYNEGNQPVEILRIFSDCSCAVADYPKKQINPSDSVRFTVSYDPRGYKLGQFRKSFRIRSNAINKYLSAVITGSVNRRLRK